jgi:hypothetical protein
MPGLTLLMPLRRHSALGPPCVRLESLLGEVVSAFLLTRGYTFAHTHSLTEDAMSALAFAPIFARLRGKRSSRSAQNAGKG